MILADNTEIFYTDSCYVKDNSKWLGRNDHDEVDVKSVKDCQNICRDMNITSFVWMKVQYRCICKNSVSGEVFNAGFVSGYATWSDCAGKHKT